jgi:prolipoprotein diacylglyceryltransferase
MTLQESFNRQFDRLVRPEVSLFGLTRSTFLVMGYVGLFLANLLAMFLVMWIGLSYWIMELLIVTAVMTFLALNMLVKIITGEETIVCIHHQVAVLVVTTLLLKILQQPVLPYLAITMLGVGVFIAMGRIGCLMVGCCHGRPSRWGVCYRHEHAAAGFAPYFVGVRFFPIQAVASLLLFGNVAVGTLLMLLDKPGQALIWYLVMYCTGRFFLEFFRGDPDRAYFRGLSEPQWNALALTLAVFMLGVAGWLPVLWWQVGATAVVNLCALIVITRTHLPQKGRLYYWQPRHVREVAEVVYQIPLEAASGTPIALDIKTTSLGICISGSRVQSAEGLIKHYALSATNGTMTARDAADVANLILHLQHPAQPSELVTGHYGVFHLLVKPQPAGAES